MNSLSRASKASGILCKATLGGLDSRFLSISELMIGLEADLKRLLHHCLNGFHDLSNTNVDESYTFPGTVILVDERPPEPSFDGTSLLIVDGQQGITTLSLLCSSLVEQILSSSQKIEDMRTKPEEMAKARIGACERELVPSVPMGICVIRAPT